jgi:hypothetical protein
LQWRIQRFFLRHKPIKIIFLTKLKKGEKREKKTERATNNLRRIQYAIYMSSFPSLCPLM